LNLQILTFVFESSERTNLGNLVGLGFEMGFNSEEFSQRIAYPRVSVRVYPCYAKYFVQDYPVQDFCILNGGLWSARFKETYSNLSDILLKIGLVGSLREFVSIRITYCVLFSIYGMLFSIFKTSQPYTYYAQIHMYNMMLLIVVLKTLMPVSMLFQCSIKCRPKRALKFVLTFLYKNLQ